MSINNATHAIILPYPQKKILLSPSRRLTSPLFTPLAIPSFAPSPFLQPQFSHISPILHGRNMGEIWEN
ncbi:MAG: hypothetical protein IKN11_10785 [Bacteroidales bacterium]|nr:hypothetical protein [Bacteroidales bacterium]